MAGGASPLGAKSSENWRQHHPWRGKASRALGNERRSGGQPRASAAGIMLCMLRMGMALVAQYHHLFAGVITRHVHVRSVAAYHGDSSACAAKSASAKNTAKKPWRKSKAMAEGTRASGGGLGGGARRRGGVINRRKTCGSIDSAWRRAALAA